MAPLDRRAKLSAMLHEVLGSDKVHFEPPETIKMEYPAIVYNKSGQRTVRANDGRYLVYDRYTITFIHKDADSETTESIGDLPYCELDRQYTADDLYHDVFTIYI